MRDAVFGVEMILNVLPPPGAVNYFVAEFVAENANLVPTVYTDD